MDTVYPGQNNVWNDSREHDTSGRITIGRLKSGGSTKDSVDCDDIDDGEDEDSDEGIETGEHENSLDSVVLILFVELELA